MRQKNEGRFVLDNVRIVSDGSDRRGFVVVCGDSIEEVGEGRYAGDIADVRDLGGKLLLPGVIDTHVHFREPGFTRKADIASESRAAAAGGVTSFCEMPNTRPQTLTIDAWDQKMRRAEETSAVNYAFYIGASTDTLGELRNADFSRIPAIKLFLGASTGASASSDDGFLDEVFSFGPMVAVHSEDQEIIDRNTAAALAKYGKGNVPISEHPVIRSAEACYECTRRAVERAERCGTHLHVCHVTTAAELPFFYNTLPLEEKKLTAEACVQHLFFTDEDYSHLGARIKCNPSVKSVSDREALLHAVADGTIDVVSTDHAPHTLADKEGDALTAASGLPLIQFSLPAMIELSEAGHFPLSRVVEVMSENQARLFGIDRRGFIRPGYFADLVVVDPERPLTVTEAEGVDREQPEVTPGALIRSKCGWSPFAGHTFPASVVATYVNGCEVFSAEAPAGETAPEILSGAARPLRFTR